ncbi:alpha-isopropylmalate synthase regulatory domain-containing protein [Legionella israelensis]|uniref:2-isopropylmalate synthase n=1 Tax=Legionella israelensis TaxID=454 RepID=A0A0W0VF49_9GAMM|nr:alpha-isopropylmalate synthase regulatory domain-containing protein [Legionella israelensis]KTD18509.1 2-isopropylmalate synthase [Legionella israelensis]QBS10444.1 2-isopropylmalate synthase [Legionella israelensis]SCY51139.1 2-isopropylmalate synthase [Legionella israelensis DSM 19235]STX60067.1 2-isopropylmalate synthase [Legionella israelensis]
MKKKERIYIFDTTLRDGQQSPGAGMSFEDNIKYTEYADALGIDVLEAGFPAASQYDFEIVQSIAKHMAQRKSNMTIAALCQLREEQIIRTMKALEPSLVLNKARLHTYVPVDPNLMRASLGKSNSNCLQIIENIYRYISLATSNGFEVEFSAEGYSRMQGNFDFTTDAIRAAVSAGATVINCPDTIGGASRWQKDYFVWNMNKHADIIKKEFPQQEVTWSAHCHNDFGLSLDNSINAIVHGPARQIEGCMNGVGERAGNAALEQCIMLIDQFGRDMHSDHEFYTDINLQKLSEISDFIAQKMLSRQPHWPITGQNAARHSSGGHTNAILKNPLAYQPFDPKQIGQEVSFIFGPLSGGNHAKHIIEKNGYRCETNEKVSIAQGIKDKYPNRRKGITDEEVIKGYKFIKSPIKLEGIEYSKNESGHMTLKIHGTFFSKNGIVIKNISENSALAALDKAVKAYFPLIEITDYRSNSCAGNDVNAKCMSTVIVSIAGQDNFIGKAIDSDIHISALKAYIDAVNQAYVEANYQVFEEVRYG